MIITLQTLNYIFSASYLPLRHRCRVRLRPGSRQRLADAPVASRSPLAPAHLPLRLRLHPRRERSGNRGGEQQSGRGKQVGEIGRFGLRQIGGSLRARRPGMIIFVFGIKDYAGLYILLVIFSNK